VDRSGILARAWICALVPLAGCVAGAQPQAARDGGAVGDAGRADADLADAGRADGGVPDGGVPDGGIPGDFDSFMLAHMMTARTPGLAAAVVRGDQVVLARAWGRADIAANRPATPDTLFMLASISKTVTAVALMQLYEQGRFGLDDPIDTNLGRLVRNPNFPSVPITYRMLLSHTSSIEDGLHYADYYVYDMDSPIALDAFVTGYLSPGGAYYDASNWSGTGAPGTSYSYTNAGVALAGDLVERISGLNLQQYCQQHIFTPLGMGESSFFLRDLDRTHIAMPYDTDASGNYTPDGYYAYPDYPDGQLRTSASQLARFLMAFSQYGQLGGAQILQRATVEEMRRQQPSSQEGLCWEFTTIGGRNLTGHDGADYGVTTSMYFDPVTGAGIVVLTNGAVSSSAEMQALAEMQARLLQVGEP